MRALVTAIALTLTITSAYAWKWDWRDATKTRLDNCTSYCTPVSDYMPW